LEKILVILIFLTFKLIIFRKQTKKLTNRVNLLFLASFLLQLFCLSETTPTSLGRKEEHESENSFIHSLMEQTEAPQLRCQRNKGNATQLSLKTTILSPWRLLFLSWFGTCLHKNCIYRLLWLVYIYISDENLKTYAYIFLIK
jgi:hypothetical protein